MPTAQTVDVLAIGAHPDDVELGCGGTLVKLKKLKYKTAIVDLTEGELGSRGTVAQRYQEAAESSKILGLSFRKNLKIPDGQISASVKNRNLLIRLIREAKPKLLLAPFHEDRHPDHVHANQLITEAWFYTGVKKVLPDMPPHRPYRILYYMSKYDFKPSFVIDITDEFDRKYEALSSYKSQFFNPEWPEEQTFISSKWFMDSVDFRARHYGWMAGVKYGEPFWIRESMAIDDPIPLFSRSIQ
jgi:bacillithiol biosynthesis deacetylase BshB1